MVTAARRNPVNFHRNPSLTECMHGVIAMKSESDGGRPPTQEKNGGTAGGVEPLFSLNKCTLELGLVCASGRTSLRVATSNDQVFCRPRNADQNCNFYDIPEKFALSVD